MMALVKTLSIDLAIALAIVLASATAGCSDEVAPGAASGSAKAKPAPRPVKARGKATDVAAVPLDLPPLPVREFNPRDFDESELSRDPFRSFEEMFRAQAQRKVVVQREVLASKFSLDQLKMVAIVTGQGGRVMMNDPGGFGWVMKVGDFVGRPEVVRTGGPSGAEVAVNWRLDRIRANDAVFVREDPTRTDVPATTRVVSLRTDAELNPEIRTGIRGGGSVVPPPPGGAEGGNPQLLPAPPAPPPPKSAG